MWVIFLFIPTSLAFTAYDCSNLSSAAVSYSLLDPAPCPDYFSAFAYQRRVNTEVVQVIRERIVPITRCRVLRSSFMQYCGHSSAAGVVRPVSFREVTRVEPSDCRAALITGRLNVFGRERNFTAGVPNSAFEYSAGVLEISSKCENAEVSWNGHTLTGQVAQNWYEIFVNQEIARVDDSTGFITLASGVRALYSDQSMVDAMEGTIVWNMTRSDCLTSIAQVYRGPADLHTNQSRSNSPSLLIIDDPKNEQVAGLELGSLTTLCDNPAYESNIKGLMVFLHPDDSMSVAAAAAPGSAYSESARLESSLSYLHVKATMGVNERMRQVKAEICENRRETVYLRLEAIAGANNPYSLNRVVGRGHVVIRSGAVVYVSKCQEVDVVPRENQNCTEEIPVLLNSTLAFVDPISMIIKSAGTIIRCNDISPPRWLISGQWYCGYPSIRECHGPKEVSFKDVAIDGDMSPTDGLGMSIYTESQRQEYLSYQESILTRQAYWAEAASNAFNSRSSDGSWGLPFSGKTMDSLLGVVGTAFVPLYLVFGSLAPIVLLIMTISAVAEGACRIVVRAIFLVRTRGFGIWILGAFWGVLYHIIMAPVFLGAKIGAYVGEGTSSMMATAPPKTEQIYPSLAVSAGQAVAEEDSTTREVNLSFISRMRGSARVT